MSLMKRCPCVVIAIRSTFLSRASLMISSDGSPSAKTASQVKPSFASSRVRVSKYARSSFISWLSASLSCWKFRATQPSATWTRSNAAPVIRARGLMCVRTVSSAALFSSGIRMCLYILMHRHRNVEETVERFERGIWHDSVQEQFHVEQNNDRRCRPPENFQPKPTGKLTHLRASAGKSNQRPHREAELHA